MKNLDNIATLMEKFEGVLNEILDELEKSYEDDVCNDEKLAKAKDDYDDALMELDDLYREKEYELDEYIPNFTEEIDNICNNLKNSVIRGIDDVINKKKDEFMEEITTFIDYEKEVFEDLVKDAKVKLENISDRTVCDIEKK